MLCRTAVECRVHADFFGAVRDIRWWWRRNKGGCVSLNRRGNSSGLFYVAAGGGRFRRQVEFLIWKIGIEISRNCCRPIGWHDIKHECVHQLTPMLSSGSCWFVLGWRRRSAAFAWGRLTCRSRFRGPIERRRWARSWARTRGRWLSWRVWRHACRRRSSSCRSASSTGHPALRRRQRRNVSGITVVIIIKVMWRRKIHACGFFAGGRSPVLAKDFALAVFAEVCARKEVEFRAAEGSVGVCPNDRETVAFPREERRIGIALWVSQQTERYWKEEEERRRRGD